MNQLYTKGSIIFKLWEQFSQYFSEQTKPTKKHLFELMLSVLALNGFQSMRCNYEHFIKDISQAKLKSYYFTLNESKIDISKWMEHMIRTALSVIPKDLEKQPVILSIDDTMIEKYGEKFENCLKMFDHAAHNGSNYLNGHCFVSLLLSVPAEDERGKQYLSIPVGYRMWTKEKSKLEIAAELVQSAMQVIGPDRPVCLCCDSWYPKGAVLSLPSQFDNLTLICNVRSDTVMFEMPPHSAGKRGRPRKYGKRVTPMDFSLKEIADTGFCAGARTVLTNLFGSSIVYAIVTKAKKTNSYRLFLYTKNPNNMIFDVDFLRNSAALAYAEADKSFLPLAIYSLRWNIEVSFYQQKTFWSLGGYMLRGKDGIERLLNLLTLLFSSMTLLPWLCQDFSNLKGCSPQHVRFVLGSQVRQQIFLSTFAHQLQTAKNISDLINCLNSLSIHLPFIA